MLRSRCDSGVKRIFLNYFLFVFAVLHWSARANSSIGTSKTVIMLSYIREKYKNLFNWSGWSSVLQRSISGCLWRRVSLDQAEIYSRNLELHEYVERVPIQLNYEMYENRRYLTDYIYYMHPFFLYMYRN